MYYVYIIKSRKRNWYYIGFTENPDKRLKEHNLGQVRSTNFYKPFDLVFVQLVDNRLKARDLEKFLKVKYNKEALLETIKK